MPYVLQTCHTIREGWSLSVATGAAQGNPSEAWSGEAGTTSPTDYDYTGSTEEKASILSSNIEAFSDGEVWSKANGLFPILHPSLAINQHNLSLKS